ncbi:MAG: kinase [Pseudonocardiales bacterium]|nr:MAG: kinase [Pseudonocardiales bacterium]
MLVVFAGRPGTGKTTLSRLLGAELRAAVLRIDVIEATVVRSGLAAQPVGSIGYDIARHLAADCLAAGTSVVVDAVNPVAEARQGWRTLAVAAAVPLHVVEVALADAGEHRRRVDGPRLLVDGGAAGQAMAAIRDHIGISPRHR